MQEGRTDVVPREICGKGPSVVEAAKFVSKCSYNRVRSLTFTSLAPFGTARQTEIEDKDREIEILNKMNRTLEQVLSPLWDHIKSTQDNPVNAHIDMTESQKEALRLWVQVCEPV
ncbi:hypothetical protein DAEQUDRAFT_418904 [Daedalea quercina L-15889]|uniref:Uncharacterized protein n=1 Tax=Daedalea quercina L-15889 TaxID=1314783 RepID=A0A165TJZ6_9APHY|nr:hypothetical protein DAEQUDRAFT_418904 [Daedalea quercina L-15889]